jgi:hypothetical protein
VWVIFCPANNPKFHRVVDKAAPSFGMAENPRGGATFLYSIPNIPSHTKAYAVGTEEAVDAQMDSRSTFLQAEDEGRI